MPKNSSSSALTNKQRQIWCAYRDAIAAVRAGREHSLKQFGLSISEYDLLWSLINANNHQLRMSEVADLIHQSRSHTTHATKRLEDDGYVTRKPDTSDHRGVVVALTAKGKTLMKSAQHTHEVALRTKFLARFSDDELDQLLYLLKQLY